MHHANAITLESVQAAMTSIKDSGEDLEILSSILTGKLSLVVHTLGEGSSNIDEDEKTGVRCLLYEIKEGLERFGDYCHLSQRYYKLLNDSDSMKESKGQEKIVAAALH